MAEVEVHVDEVIDMLAKHFGDKFWEMIPEECSLVGMRVGYGGKAIFTFKEE